MRYADGPPAPRVSGGWEVLVREIRAFERRIGFADTGNFAALAQEQDEYPFCGRVSRFTLPYSYQDPAIAWLEAKSEEECRAHEQDVDAYWGARKPWEKCARRSRGPWSAASSTASSTSVIHENCTTSSRFRSASKSRCASSSRTGRWRCSARKKKMARCAYGNAIRGYAERNLRVPARRSRITSGWRWHMPLRRSEISPELLLRERAAIFNGGRSGNSAGTRAK